jgi:hypothetical protein
MTAEAADGHAMLWHATPVTLPGSTDERKARLEQSAVDTSVSDMRATSSRFDERAWPQCPDGARGTQGTCDALWPAGGRHTSGTSFRSTSVSSMLRYSSFPAARGSDSRQRQFAALSASTNANGIPERKRQGWRQAALHGAVILALPMGASCVGPPNWMGRTPPTPRRPHRLTCLGLKQQLADLEHAAHRGLEHLPHISPECVGEPSDDDRMVRSRPHVQAE